MYEKSAIGAFFDFTKNPTTIPPMIKWIFWDNDGVLVDTEHVFFEVTKKTLAKYGFDLTPEEHIHDQIISGHGSWRRMEGTFSPEKIKEIQKERNELQVKIYNERGGFPFNPGVEETLTQLKESGIKMGVVTAAARSEFIEIHRHNDTMNRFMEFLVTRDDTPQTKPEPDPYLRALEITGADPSEVIVIEDSDRGISAATEAGLRSLGIYNPFNRGVTFRQAHAVLTDIRGVPWTLKNL